MIDVPTMPAPDQEPSPPAPQTRTTGSPGVARAAAAPVPRVTSICAVGTAGERDDPLGRLLARAVAARAPAGELPPKPPTPTAAAPSRTPSAPVRALQRREQSDATAIAGPRDWTTADRVGRTPRWQAACLANLDAVDSSQYGRIVERRDFYRWFYEYTVARGYTTRWPLAASIVADGAHQVADMDEQHDVANDVLGLAGVELQGVMREGNQVIFDNVLPKLKQLRDGGPITGAAALRWDMLVLAEEQALVQPMYGRMSKEALDEIDYIARQRRFAGLGAWWTKEGRVAGGPHVAGGDVPPFGGQSLTAVEDRWRYGMGLGNRFTPGGTGFNAGSHPMPAVGAAYRDGSEFARRDYRATLHYVDAWLNPNRLSRGPVANLSQALGRLSERERRELLADRSPDGWPYSTHLATWAPAVSEAVVRSALPSTPADHAAVEAFVQRFRAEAARLEDAYGTPSPYAFPM